MSLARHDGPAFISATHMDPELLRHELSELHAQLPPRRNRPAPPTGADHAGRALHDGRRGDRPRWARLGRQACSPPASARAPGCTAPTGWPATLCWRPLRSAAARLLPAVSTPAIAGSSHGRAQVWRRGELSLVDVRRLLDSAAGVLRSGAGLDKALRILRSGANSATAADAAEMAAMICSAALLDRLSALARTKGSTSRRRSPSSASGRGRSSPRRRWRSPTQPRTLRGRAPTSPTRRMLSGPRISRPVTATPMARTSIA